MKPTSEVIEAAERVGCRDPKIRTHGQHNAWRDDLDQASRAGRRLYVRRRCGELSEAMNIYNNYSDYSTTSIATCKIPTLAEMQTIMNEGSGRVGREGNGGSDRRIVEGQRPLTGEGFGMDFQFPELPDDMADAFDLLRLAIMHAQRDGYQHVTKDDVLTSLGMLCDLALFADRPSPPSPPTASAG